MQDSYRITKTAIKDTYICKTAIESLMTIYHHPSGFCSQHGF